MVLTSLATVVTLDTPAVRRVAYPFPDQPRLNETWEPGVFSVEITSDTAPGAPIEFLLYLNAAIIPGPPDFIPAEPWYSRPSAVSGGSLLSKIEVPANTNVPSGFSENVARPFGSVDPGDNLVLMVNAPSALIPDPLTIEFKSTIQGDRTSRTLKPRRIIV